MDNLYSSAPEYMGNTISDINQQLLNGIGADYDFEDLSSEALSSEELIKQFDLEATQDMAPSTVTENPQLPVDPNLLSTVDTPASCNLNSPSDMSNNLGAPMAHVSHQLQDPILVPRTSLVQQPRPVHQAMAQPNMPAVRNAASARGSQSFDLAANVQLPLYSTRGQANPLVQPNYPVYNSYQPSYHYPENGIEGNYGTQGIAQYPLQPPAAISTQSMHNIIQVSKCASCRRDPHPGPCFPHAVPQNRRPPQQKIQQVPYQEPDGRPAWLQTPPKRKRQAAFDDDSDLEVPSKQPHKKGRNPRTKRGKEKDPEIGIKMYGLFRFPTLDWISRRGFEFSYLPTGQWEKKILLSAEDLKDYIYNCPRSSRLWIQQNPAQCTERTIDADTICRYSKCPDANHTIRPGWCRIAFDEFYPYTSCGQKDPFKMAGVMHLWCFEQCIDPVEVMANGRMVPDDRDDGDLVKEKLNKMAITRDSDTRIVEDTIRPWFRKRAGQARQAPYANHEDSLSFALVKHHLDHQVGARHRSRGGRNKDRPESELKTIDVHMGRLDFWAERDTASRKKRASKQSRAVAPEPDKLPTPMTSNGLLPTRKSAELTPNGSTKNFSDMLSSVSVDNNYQFEYGGFSPRLKEEPVEKLEDNSNWSKPPTGEPRLSISALLSPSDFFLGQETFVQPCPKVETHRQDQLVLPPRRSPRFSAGNTRQSFQTETKATTSPAKFQASGSLLPTEGSRKESLAVPSTPKGQRAPSLSDDSLFGSPVKDKSPRQASIRAGEEVQGSPLRRSSRMSAKKTP
ncbi:uncharacterized protein BKA55DRAFT_589952 [Fusarium redolens]|uniref:Uncharacterized protein n=1 Tax=Fusarium redolens TaxID=48865 RepID=A0A9P9KS80_FUSRE|nr:uncharacterized protein BKA55DRAFT_589952 [Fusarium redolens]KAH7267583.1 hypothetical protein BKA55DRAFT_589952 [Fusarium redolens]